MELEGETQQLTKPAGIPHVSGCYIFRNAVGTVIYVGKAQDLNSRLSSYFQRREGLAERTQAMMAEAAAVEWIVTPSATDALVLENEMIKQYQPRHNHRLKDDRGYPGVSIDLRAAFPAPQITRGPAGRGVRYFGPYPDVGALRRAVDDLTTAYPVRSCGRHKFEYHQRLGRPCLLYDIGKCPGPCVGAVTKEDYHETLNAWVRFFEGDVSDLRKRLEAQMKEAARERHYEEAAMARDGLHALERAALAQGVVLDNHSNVDALGVAIDSGRAAVVRFRVRHGRVIGRDVRLLERGLETDPVSIIESTLFDLYTEKDDTPGEILMGAESTVTGEYLERVRERPVRVVAPQRGRRRRVLEAAQADAEAVLARAQLRRASDHAVRAGALEELGRALGLPRAPWRVECFDMSHLQGTNYVGSMVVFIDGLPASSQYRRFHVKTVEGNNDVGAMKEVVGRRIGHWLDPSGKFPRPDLLIVDGGLGQLHAAQEAVDEAGLTGQVELAALAKREELLYRPGSSEPIMLARGSEELYLVQRLRDEAHRFAITFHRSKRGKAMTAGALSNVKGLGAKRQTRLVEHFGSLESLRQASEEELASLSWLPTDVAKLVYGRLRGENPEAAELPATGAGD
jgi:excinuclease ABC subunit C